jgi:hypothetical protein
MKVCKRFNTMYTRSLIVGIFTSLVALAQQSAQAPPFPTGGKIALQVEPTAQPRSLIQLVRMSNLIIDGTINSLMPPHCCLN